MLNKVEAFARSVRFKFVKFVKFEFAVMFQGESTVPG